MSKGRGNHSSPLVRPAAADAGALLPDDWFCLAVASVLALCPMKFGGVANVPERPSCPSDLFSLYVFTWPEIYFAALAGALAALGAAFASAPRRMDPWLAIPALWTCVALTATLGAARASTADFVQLQCAHLFGVAAFFAAAFMAARGRECHGLWLLGGVAAGLVLAVADGLEQYLHGFDATREFARIQQELTGTALPPGMAFRLADSRVFGKFTLCNSYAAHIVLSGPACAWGAWAFGRRFIGQAWLRAALPILMAGGALAGLALSGSRSAALALCLGGGMALALSPLPRRARAGGAALAAPAGLCALAAVHFLANPNWNSMWIRIDYHRAALAMTLENPLAGSGWGDFFHEYGWRKAFPSDESPHMPHNLVLSLGCQAGMPGLLAGAAALAVPPLLLRRRMAALAAAGRPWMFHAAVAWGWCAWALHALTDVNLQVPGTLATAAALLAAAGAGGEDGGRSAAPWLPAAWRTGTAALGIAAFALGMSAIPGMVAFDRLYEMCDHTFKSRAELDAVPWPAVERQLSVCQKLSPRSPFPLAVAADFAVFKGRLDIAGRLYAAAIALSPERAAFHHRLGLCLRAMGDSEGAAACFRTASRLSPHCYAPDGSEAPMKTGAGLPEGTPR